MTVETAVRRSWPAPDQPASGRSPEAATRVRLVDHFTSPEAQSLRLFLTRNRIPFEWVDLDRDPLARWLVSEGEGLAGVRLPVCLLPDGTRLEAPTRFALAGALGLRTRPSQPVYDVAIIGGGPAGLAAAVYAASEGLRTVVLERDAPGGQAGTSSRIENYPGFPRGITGQELADRALAQAQRFGAELVVANEVAGADPAGRSPFRLLLRDGTGLHCHTVIVATGVAYRLLDAPGVARLTGKGVCYGAGVVEAPLYRGRDLFVAGGANSAGQAALHLARFARSVTLLVRGESLTDMSQYLIDELAAVRNISVRYRTEVAGAEGAALLEGLVLRDRDTGVETRVPADGLAILIGHKPSTDWADGLLKRDAQGFLLTGADLLSEAGRAGRRRRWWPLERAPLYLETSVPGVFVAGDVRHGSTKRVATAVGEGAIAVQLVHQYLGDVATADARALHGAGLPGARPGHTPLLDWSAYTTEAWA